MAQGNQDTLREGVKRCSISDIPTEADTLGFEPYVSGIAEFLLDAETKGPLTLSIEGEWGCGKSSFMLQLTKALERKGAWTVSFNAWRHDKEDTLWASFALDFIRSLSGKLSFLHRHLARVTLWLRRYDWEQGWPHTALFVLACIIILVPALMIVRVGALQTLIRIAGDNKLELKHFLMTTGAVAYPIAAIYVVRKLQSLLVNPFSINLRQFAAKPDYGKHAAFIEEFHHDFLHIVDNYAGGRKVFVFIDDLDRCDIYKGADLIQGINLMISETSKLFFIIGMDREKIAAGLAVKYEKLLPYINVSLTAASSDSNPAKGLEFGYNFIEKFIQIPFAIPQPTPDDIRKFVDATRKERKPGGDSPSYTMQKIEIEIGNDSRTVQEIILMVAPTLDNNPRRIKQFINLFRIRAYIGSQTGLFVEPESGSEYSGMTLEKLGKFVALVMQWPRILVDLGDDPELLANLQRHVWGLPLKEKIPDYWTGKEGLIRLLKAGFTNGAEQEPPWDEKEKYSLENIDITKLTSVSPRLTVPERGTVIGGEATVSFEGAPGEKEETAEINTSFKERGNRKK